MIYIHIPFCRSFCTYCDFYSEVASDCHGRYCSALCAEIKARASEISDEINTLYIGGGTPSVLPLSVLESVVETLKSVGHGGPYTEFTVEVNPDDIVRKGKEYVEGLLRLGVNRISMGIQSFDDDLLKWMNRRHDSATARKAYSILEDAGVPAISIDLIFGMPQLTDELWKETLEKALSISSRGKLPHHISSYQLSVEPGSALAGMVERGVWSEASEEQCERQYGMLCEALSAAGYEHYEISNFALPGHEAMHNSAYWRHEPYVGFGPAAHSFLLNISTVIPDRAHSVIPDHVPTVIPDLIGDPRRQWNTSSIHDYMAAAESGCFSSVVGHETLDQEQIVIEKIMLALRTADGISEEFLAGHCSRAALSHALSSGDLVRLPSGNVRIPESRFFVSDSIISDLI